MPEQERAETEPVLEEERHPARSRSVELAQEGQRAQKLDRYEQVVELHNKGLKAADIASRVGNRRANGSPMAGTWLLSRSQTATQTTQPH